MADRRPICMALIDHAEYPDAPVARDHCNTRMHVKEPGVQVRYSRNGVISGDLWECSVCGNMIIYDFAEQAMYSPPFDKDMVERLRNMAIAGDPEGIV